MIIPKSLEELASYVETGKHVFFFTADWCGDCVYIKPVMPELEAEFPEYTFVQVDRDEFPDLASQWAIFGIPSFIVTENGKEKGRLVNKNRKTKAEISDFIKSLT